jgi:hypothetical protein
MRNKLWLSVVSLLLGAGSVHAQYVPGYNPFQPAVSPYLNLTRRDIPEYLNYFGTIRPQQQFSSAIQGLQRQQAISAAETQAGFQAIATLPATGHHASFGSHLRFFNTMGAGAGGFGMGGGVMGGGMGMMGGGMMGGMGMMGGGMMGGMGSTPPAGRR